MRGIDNQLGSFGVSISGFVTGPGDETRQIEADAIDILQDAIDKIDALAEQPEYAEMRKSGIDIDIAIGGAGSFRILGSKSFHPRKDT